MFKSRTVFVVGAGASEEVGLPIGGQLTAKISALLNIHTELGGKLTSGDFQVYETLKRIVRAEGDSWAGNTLLGSARHIGEAMEMATSIDTFLESFSHDRERMLMGKLGIAKAILNAEKSSKLGTRDHGPKAFRIKDVADTWFVNLAQLLFTGVSARNVESAFQNVSFVVFNYDRCLQVFLIRALQVYVQLSDAAAENLVKSVTILHPYGAAGSVFTNDQGRVPFGSTEVDLTQVADRINTFSETVRDVQTLQAVRDEISAAETLVFLGFGFHEQNMEVLSKAVPKMEKVSSVRRVLATVYGLSASDTQVVRALIASTLRGRPQKERDSYSIDTFNGTCSKFFAEYWRSLTAA